MILHLLIVVISLSIIYLLFEHQNDIHKNNYKIKHKFIYPSTLEQQHYSTMYNNEWIYDLKLPNLESIKEFTLSKI